MSETKLWKCKQCGQPLSALSQGCPWSDNGTHILIATIDTLQRKLTYLENAVVNNLGVGADETCPQAVARSRETIAELRAEVERLHDVAKLASAGYSGQCQQYREQIAALQARVREYEEAVKDWRTNGYTAKLIRLSRTPTTEK